MEAGPVQRSVLSPPRDAPGRSDYIVRGGLIGLMVGALYAGADLGKGGPGARDRVLTTPLIGVSIGAAVGALWFEVTRPRR